MSGTIALLADRFRVRVETKGAHHDLVYPWWIAIFSVLGQAGSALVATAQRDALLPPGIVAIAVLLIAAPYVVQYTVRPWVPWWVATALVLAGVAWLLSVPVPSGEPIDMAPVVLVVLVADVTATDGLKRGLVAAALTTALLLVSIDLDDGLLPVYLGEPLFGLVIGYMLWWQARALAAEHAAREDDRARAAMSERQRIAREIHDLVAHSLSVTMLHVTGARRALTEDADIADAIEALTDAERIGRQAMTDIRRTVSVLATEPAGARPLPGAADVADLIADARAAGLDVSYTSEGDVGALLPASGLGVFRVVQESLANVLKHAPGAPVAVRLAVDRDGARLTVRNPLPVGARAQDGGSGLVGMTARADQLGGTVRVGPEAGEWRVDLTIPVEVPTTSDVQAEHDCVVRRILP